MRIRRLSSLAGKYLSAFIQMIIKGFNYYHFYQKDDAELSV